MQVLLMRHEQAEDRLNFAKKNRDDNLRPLTKKGEDRIKQTSRSLKLLFSKPNLILSSPLIRAQQTALPISKIFPKTPYQQTTLLSPEKEPSLLIVFLKQQKKETKIILVSHEPFVSYFLSELIGKNNVPSKFKKGAVCLLKISKRKTTLLFYKTPKDLLKLSK